jgi:adenylosuccinate lyase
MASEDILLAATKRGADRQEAHEVIRRHSQAAAHAVKSEGKPNDLLARLRTEPMFAGMDLETLLDASAYIGRAPAQVDAFITNVVEPVRARYRQALGEEPSLRV